METDKDHRLGLYLLSLPERVLRSASALGAGLVREIGDFAIPGPVRRTHLYRRLVEGTLRFLIEEVGEVKETYPNAEQLANNFLLQRTAGHGVELIGLLTFHASPVWVMAALADISGAGRQLIQEITASLQKEGLLEPDATFETVDQMLDGLEKTAGRAAQTLNTPPVDVATLRREWTELRKHAARIPRPRLPSSEMLWKYWADIREEASVQNRSVFELSTLMALSAIRRVPSDLRWLGLSATLAVERTGQMFGNPLFAHYSEALRTVRRTGFVKYWQREFRPYLRAAAQQFSPEHMSLTQRLMKRWK